MNAERHLELRNRTKAFALRIIRLSQALPKTREASVINNQVLKISHKHGGQLPRGWTISL